MTLEDEAVVLDDGADAVIFDVEVNVDVEDWRCGCQLGII